MSFWPEHFRWGRLRNDLCAKLLVLIQGVPPPATLTHLVTCCLQIPLMLMGPPGSPQQVEKKKPKMLLERSVLPWQQAGLVVGGEKPRSGQGRMWGQPTTPLPHRAQ